MAQLKFGRNYRLEVQGNDNQTIIISLPFTIEFALSRVALGSVNTCQIRITGLGPTKRDNLRHDWTNYSTDKIVKLYAGYGDNMPLIFYGQVSQAWSIREGVDFVTTIQCQDGAFGAANSHIPSSATFPKGTPLLTVYKTLMSYVKNTKFGKIGDSFIYTNGPGSTLLTLTSSKSFTGDAIYNLIQLSGHAFFMDNGKTYILTNDEILNTQGIVPIINYATGLLNTPLLEVSIVRFDMIFEPSLFVGQLIQLQSQTTPAINNATIGNQKVNYYKIYSIKHRCTISPAVCGDAISTVEFWPVNSPLGQELSI